jgi:hypothetical protein
MEFLNLLFSKHVLNFPLYYNIRKSIKTYNIEIKFQKTLSRGTLFLSTIQLNIHYMFFVLATWKVDTIQQCKVIGKLFNANCSQHCNSR